MPKSLNEYYNTVDISLVLLHESLVSDALRSFSASLEVRFINVPFGTRTRRLQSMSESGFFKSKQICFSANSGCCHGPRH